MCRLRKTGTVSKGCKVNCFYELKLGFVLLIMVFWISAKGFAGFLWLYMPSILQICYNNRLGLNF